MNHIAKTILLLLLPFSIYGFTSPLSSLQNCRRTNVLYSEVVEKETTTSSTIETDPKEAVKIFGRLAEKYISEFYFMYSVFISDFLCISCALILQTDLLLINFTNISILPPSPPLSQTTVLDASAGMCCYSACSGKTTHISIG